MGYSTQGERSIFVSPSIDRTTTLDTAANVTDLSFSLAANKKYYLRGNLRISCNSTGGVKFAATVPSGTTFFIGMSGADSSATTFRLANLSVSGTLQGTAFCTNAAVVDKISFEGTITVGATAGTLNIQFASGVVTQTSTVFSEGTVLELVQLS